MSAFKRFFLTETNMLLAIFLNSIVIFALYFPSLENVRWLENIDHFFIFLFTLEAIVKIRHLGWQAYWESRWNRFDLTIVLGSMPTLLTGILPVPDTSLLIVLRLFRLLRLVRFLRFIPNMAKIMQGLGRALKSSVFVILALMFLNLLLALISCQLYGKVAPEYFGNPLVSAYSIFQLFTIEGWNDIAQAVAIQTDNDFLMGMTRFYFGLVVLLGGIFGMSLANAVFVDEMTMDNNNELEAKIDNLQLEIRALKELLQNRQP
ncbi:MAG: ion transporter [Saprospiraceae bacterium]